MNLHATVSGAISSVNPMRDCTIKVSSGYTTADDGAQTSKYLKKTGKIQLQPLSTSDLKKMQGLNIQGVEQKGYLTGNYEGCFRVLGKGGDLIKIGDRTYLVTAVLERWPDWCSVGLTMQLD